MGTHCSLVPKAIQGRALSPDAYTVYKNESGPEYIHASPSLSIGIRLGLRRA